jgi:hypothetical protein
MSEYSWLLHDAAGSDIRRTESFSSKEEAESWMGEQWRSLLDEGAESVSLTVDEDVLYRMGLREE